MQFSEFPLRPHGQPWPGLKPSSSRLMTIGGAMSDCTNVIINTPDVLEKRKGLVRGFDEQFGGVICGMFKYTDEFGRESIILADETGFSIRTPFAVPVFTQSDAYPFDPFTNTGGTYPISTENWRNTARYEGLGGYMRLASGVAGGLDVDDYTSFAMKWFKQQTSRSYQVRVAYELANPGQDIFVIIKASSTLSGAALMGVLGIGSGGITTLRLLKKDSLNSWSIVAEQVVGGSSGFLTVSYNQATKVARAAIVPIASPIVTLSSPAFNSIQDLDFGQYSAIGISRFDTLASSRITSVDGGPI